MLTPDSTRLRTICSRPRCRCRHPADEQHRVGHATDELYPTILLILTDLTVVLSASTKRLSAVEEVAAAAAEALVAAAVMVVGEAEVIIREEVEVIVAAEDTV